MKNFNVGIKALIVKDDKVLLVKHVEGRKYWEVPGGRIDGDETIMQTLDRELHEELPNIKSYNVHELLDVFRITHDIKPDLSLVLVFYKVSAEFAGEPQLSFEHNGYKWATLQEALEIVDESCKAAIQKALS